MDNEAARLGVIGMIGAAFVSGWALLRGKAKSSPAETQEQINDGFKEYMAQSKADRAELHGEIRGLKSYIQVLVALLRTHGIGIPPMDSIQDGGFLKISTQTDLAASAYKPDDPQGH